METVKVAEIEGRGRGLVASRDLRGGEVILRDSCILLYSAATVGSTSSSSSNGSCTKHNSSSSYCFNCFRIIALESNSMSCNSCAYRFCSPNCISGFSHSPWVCQTIRRVDESIHARGSLELQLQARFLIAAYNLFAVSPSNFDVLLSLHGQPSSLELAAAQILHPVINPPSELLSVQLTATLLAKDKFNAFGLMEPFKGEISRSVRAYGIYPNAALFNHDCLPNACRFDYVDTDPSGNNTDLIIRLVHDVPKGREICLSYFPVNENYANRQKSLLEDYGFLCDCDRCKVEANWSDKDDGDGDGNGDDGADFDPALEENMMDEDEDEQMSEGENALQDGEDDFPHSYFFLRYMCERENCGGTLAPLPPTDANASPSPSSKVLECNVCGTFKKDDVFGDD